jgi:creatinine amidohydrolase
MRWEELTGDEFGAAVDQAEGVCLVPLSVIEWHGHPLPLGTDGFMARAVCERAAGSAPALIFADFTLTQIPEARHGAGTISIAADLILPWLGNICREVARNGLKKVSRAPAHGGTISLLGFFHEPQLSARRDYVVYSVTTVCLAGDPPAVPSDPTSDSHAGAGESSRILALHSALVPLDRLPDTGEEAPLNRRHALHEARVGAGIGSSADHPTHYASDAHPANAAAGERMLDFMGKARARVIRGAKDDQATPALAPAFYKGAERPTR